MLFLDTSILNQHFLILKPNNFGGDLTDVSAKKVSPVVRWRCMAPKFRPCIRYCFARLLVQVGEDNSNTYNSDSAITRTLFGRRNRARQLKCVSITRIPLYLGRFCYSRPVRVIEAYLHLSKQTAL